VLLVDDDQAHVGERCGHRQARSDHDLYLAGPNTTPFVGTLAFAEGRVNDRDRCLEVGPQPVDERHGEGDLGYEHEGRPTDRLGSHDRLGVNGGLSPAGDAVEEDGRRVPLFERLPDSIHSRGLRGAQLGARRSRAPCPERPVRKGPAGSLAHVAGDEASPHQAGHGRGQGRTGQNRAREARLPGGIDRAQELRLSDAEWATSLALPPVECPQGFHAFGGERQPALVARAGTGPSQRPIQREQAATGKRAEAPGEPRSALGRREVADEARPRRELLEEVEVLGCKAIRRRTTARFGALAPPLGYPFGDQLQALEHARGQHRPDHGGRRSQEVGGDPAGELERQGRQQRAIGANAFEEGLDRVRSSLGPAQDHTEGLALPELDEDGLAGPYVGQPPGHLVGVRLQASAGGVDGDFHQPPSPFLDRELEAGLQDADAHGFILGSPRASSLVSAQCVLGNLVSGRSGGIQNPQRPLQTPIVGASNPRLRCGGRRCAGARRR